VYLNLAEKDYDKYIYRVVSLERLVELFVSKENTLVKPKLWEDTFENFILQSPVQLSSGLVVNYDLHESMYGQCWTLHKSSDAMWRIYSQDKGGLRIRTTIKKLINSACSYEAVGKKVTPCIGKVEYLSDKGLQKRANTTFNDKGISKQNIFRSLLVKRAAFKHENEVRFLIDAWGHDDCSCDLFKYVLDPNDLIDQIMVDPRKSPEEYETVKHIIRASTGYKGVIKRSLLYALPKECVLSVSKK